MTKIELQAQLQELGDLLSQVQKYHPGIFHICPNCKKFVVKDSIKSYAFLHVDKNGKWLGRFYKILCDHCKDLFIKKNKIKNGKKIWR